MAGISISGLGSSLDVESIIAKLMQVESAPRARLELRQGQAKAREEALREIGSKLQAVSDAAADLRSISLWSDVQAVQSSAPNSVAVRQLSGAGPGGYQVEVTQLARAEQRTYAFSTSATPSQLTINGKAIELGANATLADAVAAINARSETGVYAVASGGQLVLSGRQTGAANTIAASGATVAENEAKRKIGLDAVFSVDGVVETSASNVVTSAVPGLELTLKSLTAGAATITIGNPGPDDEAIEAKLKSFLATYNSAVDAIRAKLTDPRVPQATTQAQANHGVLFGDTQFNGLLAQMRQFVNESGIGALGISTGAPGAAVGAESDSVLGHLVLDQAKLGAALTAEPAAMKKLASGFAESLSGLLAPTIGTSGTISGRIGATSSESRQLSESMTALNTRLEKREERLHLQFAALESTLLKSHTQSNWLSGQLAQLPSPSSS
jgi:flagellar hook-associated protein 2